MRTAIAFLVIGALSAAVVKMPVHAQTTAPPQFNSRSSNELSVVIEGCINRRRLQPNLTAPVTRQVFELLDTKELRLEGARGLMRTLEKEHDGHQDEITGIVIVPKDRDIRAKTGQAGPRARDRDSRWSGTGSATGIQPPDTVGAGQYAQAAGSVAHESHGDKAPRQRMRPPRIQRKTSRRTGRQMTPAAHTARRASPVTSPPAGSIRSGGHRRARSRGCRGNARPDVWTRRAAAVAVRSRERTSPSRTS